MEGCQERFCSQVSQAVGEEPVGTAGFYDLLILLEVPLPWEREIWKSPAFPPGLYELGLAAQQQSGRKFRYLCVAPDRVHSRPDRRRVMLFQRPEGSMAGYERREYLLPLDEVVPLVGAALAGQPLPPHLPTASTRDLLVCTHGSMDAACARYGYPVFEHLRRVHGAEELRVWRVSHFGGHRFAPTLIDLPDGRWWAHMTPDSLEHLLRREGPVSALSRHYRGWGALPTPFEQVLERAAFEAEGWGWLDCRKESQVLERDPDGRWAEVAIAYQRADGASGGTYRGRVEVSHQLMTALVSQHELEPVNQYRVSRLERLP